MTHIVEALALLEEVLRSKAEVGTFNKNAFTGLRNFSVYPLCFDIKYFTLFVLPAALERCVSVMAHPVS